MPRLSNRLNARKVATLSAPGRHADGDGLYLSIGKSGGRRWVFLYRNGGKGSRELGLGSARHVGLADARVAAKRARDLLIQGVDPIAAKHAAKQQRADINRKFGALSDAFIDRNAPGWANPIHVAQWRSTMLEYAKPLREMDVAEIRVADVVAILEPIWQAKRETARRVRGRIERILDDAKAQGLREGDNPAAWKGNLSAILPSQSKKHAKGHHKAAPYKNVPAIIGKLRERHGTAAAALHFTILTAVRTKETINATWNEIDFEKAIWTIPGSRMKTGGEHRVPLSKPAMDLLRQLDAEKSERDGEAIFPKDSKGGHLSSGDMYILLKKTMKIDATVHGFRSSFRDWVAEETTFPGAVAEMALAHAIGNATEAAYRRGDLLGKRQELMTAWADYCEGVTK